MTGGVRRAVLPIAGFANALIAVGLAYLLVGAWVDVLNEADVPPYGPDFVLGIVIVFVLPLSIPNLLAFVLFAMAAMKERRIAPRGTRAARIAAAVSLAWLVPLPLILLFVVP